MFLKALTLKGFKSFAESTTLEMQPGVTVVVGPNGSGKSNVVDAIGWVLGAQAPSARGGGGLARAARAPPARPSRGGGGATPPPATPPRGGGGALRGGPRAI